jgi:hypothetical protein
MKSPTSGLGLSVLHCSLDENKVKIKSTKISERLRKLEKAWLNSHNVIEHQAGFCAQWCLDNSCKNKKFEAKLKTRIKSFNSSILHIYTSNRVLLFFYSSGRGKQEKFNSISKLQQSDIFFKRAQCTFLGQTVQLRELESGWH